MKIDQALKNHPFYSFTPNYSYDTFELDETKDSGDVMSGATVAGKYKFNGPILELELGRTPSNVGDTYMFLIDKARTKAQYIGQKGFYVDEVIEWENPEIITLIKFMENPLQLTAEDFKTLGELLYGDRTFGTAYFNRTFIDVYFHKILDALKENPLFGQVLVDSYQFFFFYAYEQLDSGKKRLIVEKLATVFDSLSLKAKAMFLAGMQTGNSRTMEIECEFFIKFMDQLKAEESWAGMRRAILYNMLPTAKNIIKTLRAYPNGDSDISSDILTGQIVDEFVNGDFFESGASGANNFIVDAIEKLEITDYDEQIKKFREKANLSKEKIIDYDFESRQLINNFPSRIQRDTFGETIDWELQNLINRMKSKGRFESECHHFFPLIEICNPRQEKESEQDYINRIVILKDVFQTGRIFIMDYKGGTFQRPGYIDVIFDYAKHHKDWVNIICLAVTESGEAKTGVCQFNWVQRYTTPYLLAYSLLHEGAHSLELQYEWQTRYLDLMVHYWYYEHEERSLLDFPSRYAATNKHEFIAELLRYWQVDINDAGDKIDWMAEAERRKALGHPCLYEMFRFFKEEMDINLKLDQHGFLHEVSEVPKPEEPKPEEPKPETPKPEEPMPEIPPVIPPEIPPVIPPVVPPKPEESAIIAQLVKELRDLEKKVSEIQVVNSYPSWEFCPDKFGARGNGESDDSDAIQQAVNAAIANNGGVVVFNPGKQYGIGKEVIIRGRVPITLMSYTTGHVPSGEDNYTGSWVLSQNHYKGGCIKPLPTLTPNDCMFVFDFPENMVDTGDTASDMVKGIAFIDTTYRTVPIKACIYFKSSHFSRIEDVTAHYIKGHAFLIEGGVGFYSDTCHVRHCGDVSKSAVQIGNPLVPSSTSQNFVTAGWLRDWTCEGNMGAPYINIEKGNGLNIGGAYFEAAPLSQYPDMNQVYIKSDAGIFISDCAFGNNAKTYIELGDNAHFARISGANMAAGDALYDAFIHIKKAQMCRVTDILMIGNGLQQNSILCEGNYNVFKGIVPYFTGDVKCTGYGNVVEMMPQGVIEGVKQPTSGIVT